MLLLSNSQKQFHNVCIYFSKFLRPFMFAENKWCPTYRKICVYTISTTFIFKIRWLDPSCLLGTATLWPVCRGRIWKLSFLVGLAITMPGAEPANSWYSFICHTGITYKSTNSKLGERRRWRGMPWKHFWMIFTLFHQIYKMFSHLFSCFSDSLLHTE